MNKKIFPFLFLFFILSALTPIDFVKADVYCENKKDGTYLRHPLMKENGTWEELISCHCYGGNCSYGDGGLNEPCGNDGGICQLFYGGKCPSGWTHDWGGRNCGDNLGCCYQTNSNSQNNLTTNLSNNNPGGGSNSSSSSTTRTSASYSYDNPIGYRSISEFIGGVLTNLQNIIGWIAVILLVIGGLIYIFSGADSGLATTAKNTITAALIGFALVVAGPSLLRELKDIMLTGNGSTANLISNANSLQKILANFLDFIISIVIIGSIIGFMIGGITMLSASADSSQAENGKNILKYSAIAILISGIALIVVKQVILLLMSQ